MAVASASKKPGAITPAGDDALLDDASPLPESRYVVKESCASVGESDR